MGLVKTLPFTLGKIGSHRRKAEESSDLNFKMATLDITRNHLTLSQAFLPSSGMKTASISRLSPSHSATSEGGKKVVSNIAMASPEVGAHWMELSHVPIHEPITVDVGVQTVMIHQAWTMCPALEPEWSQASGSRKTHYRGGVLPRRTRAHF